MKKIIIILILNISFYTNAQEIEIGFSSGTGSIYLIENIDNDIDINYSLPIIISADIKYTPENSFFGIKLQYQNINGILKGEDWQNINSESIFSNEFEGYIKNRTILFQLEHIKNGKSKLNFGYNFGIGLTNEIIYFDKKGLSKSENKFTVLNLGGILKYPINSKISLKFEYSLLWNDPLNSFYPDRYGMGGEDINLLFEFGLTYKIMDKNKKIE